MPASAARCSTGSTAIGARPFARRSDEMKVISPGCRRGPGRGRRAKTSVASELPDSRTDAHADADVGELRAQHVGPVAGAVHEEAVSLSAVFAWARFSPETDTRTPARFSRSSTRPVVGET